MNENGSPLTLKFAGQYAPESFFDRSELFPITPANCRLENRSAVRRMEARSRP